MKKIKAAVILLFIFLLFLPLCTFNWEKDAVSAIDNRSLAPNPFTKGETNRAGRACPRIHAACGETEEKGWNPALERRMNAMAGLALVTAALRGAAQYHALEASIPYWSYILPFIHSLMGFGVFWALYRAAGQGRPGKSRRLLRGR